MARCLKMSSIAASNLPPSLHCLRFLYQNHTRSTEGILYA
jgi:hypothetical protein